MFEVLDDAGLAAEIERETRAAAASDSRRLQLIAELVGRRVAEQDDELLHWACDYWDATAAEVAAAMGIGQRAASREMRIAVALRERFPQVTALFDQGRLSSRLISTITWRTQLVQDVDALRSIDHDLAQRAADWGPLSVSKLEQVIDTLIDRHDPVAVRRTREASRGRDVCLGKQDDTSGTTSLYGRLFATDAAALKKRLEHLIAGVCQDDPRTVGQRRADALGVLGAGGDRLGCQCGQPQCPATASDARAANTVVYVLAEAAAVDAQPDPYLSGDDESTPIARDVADRPTPAPTSALIVDGGVAPAPLLAQLIGSGATVRELTQPCDQAEPRYRPSTALTAFVRMRDMTCMFPGCDRPAQRCDIDHTTPYPDGATHPSNTKCLCRIHHLLKTFWDEWGDRQQPDGTIIWTTPSGRTYLAKPGSRLFFPQWNTTTAALAPPRSGPRRTADRGAMMPRRKYTRAEQDRRQIRAERALNKALISERDKPPPGQG
ncbi:MULTISPECIES: HNH endonuclease signature motif containing protein [unclassified Mycolicibacterium]|uniref:HNH endonuclease signature motif containing protein n=1 Tax=unclassified Mycolicibacterium TaxID=2636767 RepID=UPI0012DCDABA|nr:MULTISPECIES: HNH endonuclease signature motif containing protein [unclassified Mycolicibacterium]MUL85802.1 DUF222 domain-containing protein [Mycolicibacterium sp. CBMA 329]MUL90172.1 DUF222 domain-containing protein [Mycolicibacterium sp. CBMA 331]MUM00941.1 DUF222 domain-containing protein [Mycolicibacterium sp. CBMA 334]MUM27481.1 DUF222 domain-containing protein [Mycolicibacterium sp. CBMA 295]MUM39687.1 DUF222 domain-containing protein [Mycolicibacterium sp. CBMA 247]